MCPVFAQIDGGGGGFSFGLDIIRSSLIVVLQIGHDEYAIGHSPFFVEIPDFVFAVMSLFLSIPRSRLVRVDPVGICIVSWRRALKVRIRFVQATIPHRDDL